MVINLKKIIIISAIAVIFFTARNIYCKTNVYNHCSVQKIPIENILSKIELSDDDYNILSEQTGLHKDAIDDFILSGNKDHIKTIHNLYFENPSYQREDIIFPFIYEERNTKTLTPLAPLKNGDILITFNTSSFDWRHGHCAIVINAENNLILEHVSAGSKSQITDAKLWGSYPSFAVLRYPDEKISQKATQYCIENLLDIDYNIFSGIIKKDKSDETEPISSHCSHIVWQAYMSAGVDIDRDKGSIVTPRDIFNSEKLQAVQLFKIK